MVAAASEAAAYEFRRPEPDALTKTKLQSARKQHFVEHEMKNENMNAENAPTMPKYSDRKEPWFTLKPGFNPNSKVLRERSGSRGYGGHMLHKKDVVLKPNETSPPIYAKPGTSSDAEPPQVAPMPWQNAGPHEIHALGSRTMKKWSTEFNESRAITENGKKRLFDNISKAVTLSTDYMKLD